MKNIDQLIAQMTFEYEYVTHFLSTFKKVYSKKTPTMVISFKKNNPVLYIGTEFIKKFNDKQLKAILRHEALHAIHGHLFKTQNKLDKINTQAQNVAMDVAINQLWNITEDLHGHEILGTMANLENFRKKFPEAEAGKNWEYYYQMMKDDAEENGYSDSGMETLDDHSDMGEMDEMEKLVAKQKIKDAYKKLSAAGKGQLGSDIVEKIMALETDSTNWRQELRRVATRGGTTEESKTRMRKNKRLGEMFMGRRSRQGFVGVAIVDTSGSMSDKDIGMCMGELNRLYNTGVHEITLIEADTEVTNVSKFTPKKQFEIKGRGGTAYQPAIEHAMSLKPDYIILLGDGGCFDSPENPGVPFIWLMTPGARKPVDWGKEIIMREKGND